MSVGLHRCWKDNFVNELGILKSNDTLRVLDVAGGTGDIAFKILEKYNNKNIFA